jgi:ComF family protein
MGMKLGFFDRIQEIFQRASLAAGRRCLICGKRITEQDLLFPELCSTCRVQFHPRSKGYCPQCGLCYASDSDDIYVCSACRHTPRPWSSLGFFSSYSGLVRAVITDFKFNARLPLVTLLVKMLEQGFAVHEMQTADVVVPVPLHVKRLQERGFNQSLEMARRLVPVLAAELDARSCVRTRNTRAQRGLDQKARRSNLKNAFEVRGNALAGKHVLLVDDVMTTGSTLATCARALHRGGARRVDVLVVARA